MSKILAFAGSNHQQSINYKLVNFASTKLSAEEVHLLDIRSWNVPIYSIDHDPDETPSEISQLIDLIKTHHGFVISTPEHNGNISAFLKNILDWLSRRSDQVFEGKPVLLLSTSPGGSGGANSLDYLEKSLPRQGALIASKFSLPSFYQNFREEDLNDEYREKLQTSLSEFKQAIAK
ncbi:MAG: NAD(P)H-dependent oxidoreductase [Bacteroidota bacterium]